MCVLPIWRKEGLYRRYHWRVVSIFALEVAVVSVCYVYKVNLINNYNCIFLIGLTVNSFLDLLPTAIVRDTGEEL